MRHVTRWFGVAAFLLTTACGGDGGDPPPTTPPIDDGRPRIPQTTVVVDSAAAPIVSDSAAQASGVVKLLTTQNLSLDPGDVMVGKQGGGFVRRVSSVARRGDTLVVTTSEATLEDAVERGSFSTTVPVRLNAAPTVNFHRLPDGTVSAVHWGATRVTHLAQGVSVRNGRIEISGLAFSTGVGLSLEVTEGWVRFEPDATLEIDLSNFRITRARAVATGQLTAHAAVRLAASRDVQSLSAADTFALFERDFHGTIGPVPVSGRVRVGLTVGMLAQAQAGLLSGGFDLATQLGLGVQYQSGQWSPIFERGAGFTPIPLAWDGEFSVEATTGVKPHLAFILYPQFRRFVQPEVLLEAGPQAKLRGEVNVGGQGKWRRSLTTGIGGKAEASLEMLGRSVAAAELPFTLTENVIWADSGVSVGRLSGRVVDGLTYAGIASATITFAREDGTGSPVSSTTGANGSYLSPELAAGRYTVTAAAANYVTARLNGAVVLRDDTVTVESIPLVPASPFAGSISGVVRNARNNNVVGGARVELRQGMNAVSGPVVGTTTTSASGGYALANVAPGTYTVRVQATGFVDGVRTGIVVGQRDVPGQDVVVSPDGTVSELRIVLTWGANPSDLDSHLTGPVAGGGRFHVYYSASGSLNGPPWAALDVDDVTSYGPETVTIVQQLAGVYRYSVHNYSDRSSTSSTRLSTSGARVDVYRGNTLLQRYFVPNQPGTIWTVFELEGNRVTPVNTMSYNASFDQGGLNGGSADRLPQKHP